MRAPVIGLFCAPDVDRVVAQARATAVITHAHPLGQEGAVLVALATALALDAHAPGDILEALRGHAQHALLRERIVIAHGWLGSGRTTAYDVREQLGNGITASESCVTALHIALAFLERPFGEMLAFVADCRGDVDTIGAMAGAIWGARNGESALPAQMIAQLEDPDRVRRVALALHETTNSAAPT
jgi:ADP-ribosylglycohydrolase